MCFIDYQKAFNTVRHADLLEILDRLDIGTKDLRVIRNLYYEQAAAVRVEDELTDWVKIKRGVNKDAVCHQFCFGFMEG